MKIELNNNLDDLKKKSPFKVPDGYMDGLTDQIMSQLPEKPLVEAKKVSLTERMRPWIYMAAMFAGLGLFFRFFLITEPKESPNEPLLVQSESSYDSIQTYLDQENDDYLDYLESQYEGILLAEDWNYFE